MRKAGIIILIAGFIITMITGFNYVTKETIVEIGDLEITTEKTRSTDWSPLAGFAIMAVGGVAYLLAGKEQ